MKFLQWNHFLCDKYDYNKNEKKLGCSFLEHPKFREGCPFDIQNLEESVFQEFGHSVHSKVDMPTTEHLYDC
jgi:hypothetical protein